MTLNVKKSLGVSQIVCFIVLFFIISIPCGLLELIPFDGLITFTKLCKILTAKYLTYYLLILFLLVFIIAFFEAVKRFAKNKIEKTELEVLVEETNNTSSQIIQRISELGNYFDKQLNSIRTEQLEHKLFCTKQLNHIKKGTQRLAYLFDKLTANSTRANNLIYKIGLKGKHKDSKEFIVAYNQYKELLKKTDIHF